MLNPLCAFHSGDDDEDDPEDADAELADIENDADVNDANGADDARDDSGADDTEKRECRATNDKCEEADETAAPEPATLPILDSPWPSLKSASSVIPSLIDSAE
jgi:hypothetical protein